MPVTTVRTFKIAIDKDKGFELANTTIEVDGGDTLNLALDIPVKGTITLGSDEGNLIVTFTAGPHSSETKDPPNP